MNKSLLILVVFLISSCSFTINESSKGDIVDQWMLINLNGARCNVCPMAKFLHDDTGIIIKSSMEKLEFKYHLDKNMIKFEFIKSENFFGDDSEFYYRIFEEEELQFLELNSLVGIGKYILAKEKKID